MPPQKNTSAKIIWTIISIIVIAVLAYFAWCHNPSGTASVTAPATTTSPSTPTMDETGWQTSTDPATGLNFRYPSDLGTAYIHPATAVGWPPKLTIAMDEAFTCAQGGSDLGPDGTTAEKSLNGHEYCVTTESSGTAGSTYTQYAYAFPQGNGVATLTFTLQFPDCGNYGNDPRVTACDTEETTFNIGSLADAIAQTVH